MSDLDVVDAAGRGTLELLILWRGSPELVECLQCDTSVPGLQPYEQQVFDMWCAWVTQP